ncbi:MAG: phospholipase D-like domain-containing protein [Pseudomonadota bacterium]
MMPLLLRTKEKSSASAASLNHFTSEQAEFLATFGREEIREMIAGLKHNQALHYIARMYNMHDVFADLIKLSGPASVKIISYSITEFPLRILSQLQAKKVITELDMILDFTVARTPPLKQFATHTANRIRFTDNHAKILLIKNKDWNITHIGSANFTRNNRFEQGTILTHSNQYDKYANWFEKLFEDASK